MAYNCEILADSINPQGNRITTMKITFPRFILAEFNTHRMFSRNSASSRAIPFKKMVKMVEENPFIPIAWQKDHKGMQGTEYISTEDGIYVCKKGWLEARDNAIKQATWMHSCNVTKQLCNRLLEPFMWHTVIISASEFENFFKLRCPQYEFQYNDDSSNKIFKSKKDLTNWYKDEFSTEDNPYNTKLEWLSINKSQAEIHIQAIAELMWDCYSESKPKQLQRGEWHIPFGDNIKEEDILPFIGKFEVQSITHQKEARDFIKRKIAVARCARISYQTLGDNPKIDYKADIKLHDVLAKMEHWSPFEHIARAMSDEEYNCFVQGKMPYSNQSISVPTDSMKGWCRNFKGFIQYRHLVEIQS